jgi:hypothetical protein
MKKCEATQREQDCANHKGAYLLTLHRGEQPDAAGDERQRRVVFHVEHAGDVIVGPVAVTLPDDQHQGAETDCK